MTGRCGETHQNRVAFEDKIQHNKKGRLASARSFAVGGSERTWQETKESTRQPSLGIGADQDAAGSRLLW